MMVHVAQCRFLLELADRALAELDDTHRAFEPRPGVKTAGWLVGHLAVSGDFARRLLGRSRLCTLEWDAAFNPGTTPSHAPEDYPPMATLTSAFRSVYTDLCAAASQAAPGALVAANPFRPAQTHFPTAGDFVAYLLTGHLAYHLGQLVAWRGAAGLGRLERPETLAA